MISIVAGPAGLFTPPSTGSAPVVVQQGALSSVHRQAVTQFQLRPGSAAIFPVDTWESSASTLLAGRTISDKYADILKPTTEINLDDFFMDATPESTKAAQEEATIATKPSLALPSLPSVPNPLSGLSSTQVDTKADAEKDAAAVQEKEAAAAQAAEEKAAAILLTKASRVEILWR